MAQLRKLASGQPFNIPCQRDTIHEAWVLFSGFSRELSIFSGFSGHGHGTADKTATIAPDKETGNGTYSRPCLS